MARPIDKGPTYESTARKIALKSAFASPLVFIGIVTSGISLLSLASHLFGFSFPSTASFIVSLTGSWSIR